MNPSSASSKNGRPRLYDDLLLTLDTFPLDGLLYLRQNSHLLITGAYKRTEEACDQPFGCIFNLVSRPTSLEIDSRDALSLHLTGCSGPELRDSPLYLAARRIIKAWDEYSLDVQVVLQAVDHLIARETSAPMVLGEDRCIQTTMDVAWAGASAPKMAEEPVYNS